MVYKTNLSVDIYTIELVGGIILKFIIRKDFIIEAENYAKASSSFTSNRHDFHNGGLSNKELKMYEGKLGEKVFKEYLLSNEFRFIEDNTPHTEADDYDFLIGNTKFDVKTRTKSFHTRTLEMVEQMRQNPKDIYISVHLLENRTTGRIIGWCTKEDFLTTNKIENQGYLDNYVMYDNQLRPIDDLTKYIKENLL